jgi:hypothetical protein
MQESGTTLPAGLRRFNELELARSFMIRFLLTSLGIGLVAMLLASFVFNAMDSFVLAAVCLISGPALIYQLHSRSSMLHVPLAVDMNHPFMDEDPIGSATVMIRLSDGGWVDVGEGRVRLAEDELIGGSNLVRDNEDYTLIGHFNDLPMTHRGVKKQVVLINQAIALRDAVNGAEDTIEDAREREANETGLLDRSWLEDQKEIEIEPDGLMSKLRGE